jgi:bacteriocin-like protein
MKTEDLKNQVLEQELNDEELDNVAGGVTKPKKEDMAGGIVI